MDAQLVIEIDGERATEYEVILGCAVGSESAVGGDGEWISGYVVTATHILAPGGVRMALGADERRAEERQASAPIICGRAWAVAGMAVLIGLWAAAAAVTVLALVARGG